MTSHISMPHYAGPGMVFVEAREDAKAIGAMWERMLLDEAKEQGRAIIRCALCKEPAVRLDCYWPYFSEQNRCRRHLVEDKVGWAIGGKARKHHYFRNGYSLCGAHRYLGDLESDCPEGMACKVCQRRAR